MIQVIGSARPLLPIYRPKRDKKKGGKEGEIYIYNTNDHAVLRATVVIRTGRWCISWSFAQFFKRRKTIRLFIATEPYQKKDFSFFFSLQIIHTHKRTQSARICPCTNALCATRTISDRTGWWTTRNLSAGGTWLAAGPENSRSPPL